MSKSPEEPKPEGPKLWSFTTLKNTLNYIKDSAPVKIVTGSAIGRSIGVVTVLTSATIVTIPATIIGVGSIVTGALMDTVDTRTLRLLKKENSLLAKNRKAQGQQDELLKNEPLLSEVLQDKLYVPNRSNQTSLTERYIDKTPQSTISISSYGKVLLKNSVDVVKSISGVVFTPSLTNVTKVGKTAFGLYGESKKQATKEEIGLNFKQNIDQERNKPDTPGYSDLIELAEATREQRVQTLALQKMVNDGSFRGAKPEEIMELFEAAKQEVLKTEKEIQDTRGIVGTVKSYTKDFVKAHDPFSKYNNLDQLKPVLPEFITKPVNDKTSKQPKPVVKVSQTEKVQGKESSINKAKEIKKKLAQTKTKSGPKKNKHKRSKTKKRHR